MKIHNFTFGDYYIVINDEVTSDESYRIKEDFSVIWFYGSDAKFGYWTYEEGLLEMYIKGYTGDIYERYKLVKNEWVHTEFPERKLKKIK